MLYLPLSLSYYSHLQFRSKTFFKKTCFWKVLRLWNVLNNIKLESKFYQHIIFIFWLYLKWHLGHPKDHSLLMSIKYGLFLTPPLTVTPLCTRIYALLSLFALQGSPLYTKYIRLIRILHIVLCIHFLISTCNLDNTKPS